MIEKYLGPNYKVIASNGHICNIENLKDSDERRKVAQNPHEYLIEQIQFTGDESVGSSSNKLIKTFPEIYEKIDLSL